MENMNNVLELMENLKGSIGDYGDRFTDYSNGYICDVITDIADSNVDIYNHDLWEWAKDNEEYVEEAMCEFGWDSKRSNLMQLFQMGQYLYNQEELYENLDDSIRYWILNNIEEEYITDDVLEFIENLCNNVDNSNLLEDMLEELNNYIEETKEA